MIVSPTLLLRTVTLRVSTPRGVAVLGPYEGVRAPTVAEALAVFEASEVYVADPDAWPVGSPDAVAAYSVLRAALLSWLPGRLGSRLISPSAATLCVQIAPRLVWDGVPPNVQDEAERAERTVRADAKDRGWASLVADYRALYSVADVMGEPWPLFVSMAAEMDLVRARTALAVVDALMSAKDPDFYEGLNKRAGRAPKAPPVLTEEEQAANLAKLEREWRRHTPGLPTA